MSSVRKEYIHAGRKIHFTGIRARTDDGGGSGQSAFPKHRTNRRQSPRRLCADVRLSAERSRQRAAGRIGGIDGVSHGIGSGRCGIDPCEHVCDPGTCGKTGVVHHRAVQASEGSEPGCSHRCRRLYGHTGTPGGQAENELPLCGIHVRHGCHSSIAGIGAGRTRKRETAISAQ